MTSRIDAFARRVEADPFFLAPALADYARSEHLDELGLAEALGCPVDTLSRLRLCRRPRPDPISFRADIDKIASRFTVHADVLAEAVRRSDALSRLRQTTTEGHGLLMAARDRTGEQSHSGGIEGDS